MPANFPTAEQKRYYGRFAQPPTPEELGRFFHLSSDDQLHLLKRTQARTRLGMGIQLGTVRYLGCFLGEAAWPQVPQNVVVYVAAQLAVKRTTWQTYHQSKTTLATHQAYLREIYGYRQFSEAAVQQETICQITGTSGTSAIYVKTAA